jgi:hypothetical protein
MPDIIRATHILSTFFVTRITMFNAPALRISHAAAVRVPFPAPIRRRALAGAKCSRSIADPRSRRVLRRPSGSSVLSSHFPVQALLPPSFVSYPTVA